METSCYMNIVGKLFLGEWTELGNLAVADSRMEKNYRILRIIILQEIT